mmetsp:Transcript_3858/g.15943  ORF Transcript_3858/g.15943 Transcript_3858/m.15943 type:complete len:276 (-) Transcript_3858:3215-4042(-)
MSMESADFLYCSASGGTASAPDHARRWKYARAASDTSTVATKPTRTARMRDQLAEVTMSEDRLAPMSTRFVCVRGTNVPAVGQEAPASITVTIMRCDESFELANTYVPDSRKVKAKMVTLAAERTSSASLRKAPKSNAGLVFSRLSLTYTGYDSPPGGICQAIASPLRRQAMGCCTEGGWEVDCSARKRRRASRYEPTTGSSMGGRGAAAAAAARVRPRCAASARDSPAASQPGSSSSSSFQESPSMRRAPELAAALACAAAWAAAESETAAAAP